MISTIPQYESYNFGSHVATAMIHGAVYRSIGAATRGMGLVGVIVVCLVVGVIAYLIVKKPWLKSA